MYCFEQILKDSRNVYKSDTPLALQSKAILCSGPEPVCLEQWDHFDILSAQLLFQLVTFASKIADQLPRFLTGSCRTQNSLQRDDDMVIGWLRYQTWGRRYALFIRAALRGMCHWAPVLRIQSMVSRTFRGGISLRSGRPGVMHSPGKVFTVALLMQAVSTLQAASHTVLYWRTRPNPSHTFFPGNRARECPEIQLSWTIAKALCCMFDFEGQFSPTE